MPCRATSRTTEHARPPSGSDHLVVVVRLIGPVFCSRTAPCHQPRRDDRQPVTGLPDRTAVPGDDQQLDTDVPGGSSLAPSSPASRPSPPGGLRPTLTPAAVDACPQPPRNAERTDADPLDRPRSFRDDPLVASEEAARTLDRFFGHNQRAVLRRNVRPRSCHPTRRRVHRPRWRARGTADVPGRCCTATARAPRGPDGAGRVRSRR